MPDDTQPAHRLVLTNPGDAFAQLQARAHREMRPTKSEAVKLLIDALATEPDLRQVATR